QFQFMQHDAYFIWKDSSLVKTDATTYGYWTKNVWPLIKEEDFVYNMGGIMRSLEIFFNGYIEYYEVGLIVYPFTILFFEDHLDDSGFHDNDFIENFETLGELSERRSELIQMIIAGKIAVNQ